EGWGGAAAGGGGGGALGAGAGGGGGGGGAPPGAAGAGRRGGAGGAAGAHPRLDAAAAGGGAPALRGRLPARLDPAARPVSLGGTTSELRLQLEPLHLLPGAAVRPAAGGGVRAPCRGRAALPGGGRRGARRRL